MLLFPLQFLGAILLDAAIGDPRWFPHPVRAIGWCAARIETLYRRLPGPRRVVGLLATLTIVGGTATIGWLSLWAAAKVHPAAAVAVGVFWIWTSICVRDLFSHAMAVYRPLVAGDLEEARRTVGWIVGRDTQNLDESEVTRAGVEAVAESLVDGITAPLFWALVFGPAGAIAYRAANTLDSMFGHKDERYLEFGWASARLDDILNWIPARLTVPVMVAACALLGRNGRAGWKVCLRDAHKHASPNSGLPECVMAGALGVQLGGTNWYDGQAHEKATLGHAIRPLAADDLRTACAVMALSTLLFALAGLVAWWLSFG